MPLSRLISHHIIVNHLLFIFQITWVYLACWSHYSYCAYWSCSTCYTFTIAGNFHTNNCLFNDYFPRTTFYLRRAFSLHPSFPLRRTVYNYLLFAILFPLTLRTSQIKHLQLDLLYSTPFI